MPSTPTPGVGVESKLQTPSERVLIIKLVN